MWGRQEKRGERAGGGEIGDGDVRPSLTSEYPHLEGYVAPELAWTTVKLAHDAMIVKRLKSCIFVVEWMLLICVK